MYNPIATSLPQGAPPLYGAGASEGGGGGNGGGGGGGDPITRSFFFNEGLVNNMTIPRISLVSDYVMTFDIWTPSVNGSQILASGNRTDEYIFLSNGALIVKTRQGQTTLHNAVINSEYTTITITKAPSGSLTVHSTAGGGISILATVPAISQFAIERFGRYYNNSLKFTGVLANFHIADNDAGKDYLYAMDDVFSGDSLNMKDTGLTGEAWHGGYQGQAHNYGTFTQDDDGDWAGENLDTPRSWPSDKVTMVVV